MAFHFLNNIVHDAGAVLHGNSNPGGGVFGFLDKQLLPQSNQDKINRDIGAKAANVAAPYVKQAASSVGKIATVPYNAERTIQGAITGNQGAQQQATQQLHAGVSTAREFAQAIPAGIGALTAGVQGKREFQATNPVFKFLAGSQPTPTPYGVYGSARDSGKGVLPSLGVAGLVGGLESPIGPKSALGGSLIIKNIVKSSTEKEAYKALVDGGIDKTVAKQIAPAVAHTKDPNIIKNIIDQAHTPPPSPEDILASRATSVATPPEPAGQGTPALNEAVNKHLQTISNANSTSKEVSDAVGALKQIHEMRNTQKLSDEAGAAVQKDPIGSLSEVMSSENPTDKQVAMGHHLIIQAQNEGNIGQAVNLAEHLDNTLREHGRAIQAASIIGRLTPEGRLIAAERKIRRAREASPNASKQVPTAREIKNSVEGAGNLKEKDINGLIDESTKAAQQAGATTELTTGEQIAKKVGSAASPVVKKPQVDQLVNEIVKKVKQEHLEPKPGFKRDPLDIIKEVMSRNPEAQAAYPEAQKILEEKYANNEVMQNALGQFFNSKLGTPVAGSTFDRAIGNQLKTAKTSVGDIIKQSIKNQRTSVDQITEDITKEGFDPQSAQTIAREVSNRLTQKVTEAKKKALENMSKEAKDKNQPTYIEKLNKLSNLGALDNKDYLDLARAKLNLPHLTEETGQKIHDLSQRIQGLPDGAEKYGLIRELHDTINSQIPTTHAEWFRQVFAAPRSALASTDVSGLGRQGEVLGLRFPKEWKAAWGDSIKAFTSQKFYDDQVARLNTREDMPPEYLALREKAGVAVAGGPDALHEEAFASTLPEKIPVAGKVVESSDRAFTLGLSSLRDRAFENIYKHYQDIKPMSTWTDEEIKSIGRFINTSSGRGDLGKFLETHGKTLQEALFSPKLWKSRLDLVNPLYYYHLKGPARTYAAQSGAAFMGTSATIMALAIAAGATVESDARSSDFLKVKVGDTRFDILSGLQQNLVFLHRELPGSIGGVKTVVGSGEKKSSQTGKVTDLNSGKFGVATRLSVLSDLIQSKENPTLAAIATQLKGQDKSGNVLTTGARLSQLGQLFVPLTIQDTYNNITHSQNVVGGLSKSIPGIFGVGVNSYGLQDINVTGKNKEYLDGLQQKGADPKNIAASKEFFQILKGAPDKQIAIDKVHKAIDDGNYQKAIGLAVEYNAMLDQYIQNTGWVNKNDSYISPYLEKQYESSKLNLTPASVKAYLRSKETP